jgi:AraC family transcriptional regulator
MQNVQYAVTGKFSLERDWFPAGEGSGSTSSQTYLLSMADSSGTFVEWSGDGGKRKRSRAISGDLWVLPPGESWWARRESGKTCIQLMIDAGWVEQMLPYPSAFSPQEHIRDPLIAQMLRTLTATVRDLPPNPTSELYQESLVTALVFHVATNYGKDDTAIRSGFSDTVPLPPERLRAISRYVSDRLARRISLTELAHVAGLSASQFSLRFRESTGQTPHQFITAIRVDRAREMLISGQGTPAVVAALTGFADQAHLTRHLRRAFGITPGALQKTISKDLKDTSGEIIQKTDYSSRDNCSTLV